MINKDFAKNVRIIGKAETMENEILRVFGVIQVL